MGYQLLLFFPFLGILRLCVLWECFNLVGKYIYIKIDRYLLEGMKTEFWLFLVVVNVNIMMSRGCSYRWHCEKDDHSTLSNVLYSSFDSTIMIFIISYKHHRNWNSVLAFWFWFYSSRNRSIKHFLSISILFTSKSPEMHICVRDMPFSKHTGTHFRHQIQ